MAERDLSNSFPLPSDSERRTPDSLPHEDATLLEPLAESASRPAHRIKGMKVGDHGVQFFVTAKDQLYDIEDVTAGEFAFQTVGVWDDKTIAQVADGLRQRNLEGLASKTATKSAPMKEPGRRLGGHVQQSGST
jgi:hypothetical protein